MALTMDFTTHVWWYTDTWWFFLGWLKWQPGRVPHEFSNARLREHYYGGWVAPGIYYMGAAGVLRVGCLRIAGISGSFASGDLVKGLDSINIFVFLKNICWKLILYIYTCACVMFILVLSIVHVQLLSLDMVVWDADTTMTMILFCFLWGLTNILKPCLRWLLSRTAWVSTIHGGAGLIRLGFMGRSWKKMAARCVFWIVLAPLDIFLHSRSN